MRGVRCWGRLLLGLVALGLVSGCGEEPPPKVDDELVFYSWPEDLPQSVQDAFLAECGIKIVYRSYGSTDEAMAAIRSGLSFDVAVLDSPLVTELAREGLIAPIDYGQIPNFRDVSANFRDLIHDPGNRYSVPYNWGITGLLVRTDRAPGPITGWADLWDPRLEGRVLLWDVPRHLTGVALQSLGYSINSEDPAELEAALGRLLALKARAYTSGYDPALRDWALDQGGVVVMPGWAGDVLAVRERHPEIAFVVPAEGGIQWGDNLVISASSPRKASAERLLDFLLRADISAKIVNEMHYPTASEAARPLIHPELLKDAVIFPAREDLDRAEIVLPLSPAGQARHAELWARYLSVPAGRSRGTP